MKYYVLKIEDIKNALPIESKDTFTNILHSIRKYRQILGKKKNYYLVVNIDEPYAVEIFSIMNRHGHTPCADCLVKESSACDDKCVWSKLYKAAFRKGGCAPACEDQRGDKCTVRESLCGITGENTCCLTCGKAKNCEDPCEHSMEKDSDSHDQ